MLITALSMIGTVISFVVSLTIILLVLRFAFDVIVGCVEMVWSVIHKPSLDKMKKKIGVIKCE
jgi:hypothetical protein